MSKLYFKVASDWQEVVRLRNEIAKLETQIKSMDANKAPQAVAVLNSQLQQTKQQMQGMITEAAKAGAEMETGFKRKIFDASQSINGFTEKIIVQKTAIKGFEQDLRRVQEAWSSAVKNGQSTKGLENPIRLKKVIIEEKDALFNLTQEQANARLSVKKLRDEYSLYKNDGKQVVETNQSIGSSIGKAFAIIGGVAAIKQLGSEIIKVRGEFQSMQTAIETLVGKDIAGNLIPQIKELAKISPLTLSDMVGAEKMMLGFNIKAEDTIRYLQALGDISMGNSQKFNSLTLAFSQMSATGKLMGQDLNQMINAGFNPLQQLSEKTGKSMAVLKEEMGKGAISAEMVQQAFLDATAAGGKFYNMSENASRTIKGQISMMQDALDEIFNEIGTKGEGAIMSGIQATTSLVQNYETVGKILTGLVGIYGTYRTALLINSVLELGSVKAVWAKVTATKAASIAQATYNKVLMMNPYIMVGAALVSLGIAMWTFADNTSTAERAQKRFNERQEEAQKLEQEHKQKIDSLVESSRDSALSDLQRGQSLAELRKEYPKIFAQYDIETIKLADILKLKQQIAEEDAKRADDRFAKDFESASKSVSDYETQLAAKQINGGKLTQQEINKLKELRAYRDEFLIDKGKGVSEQFISNLKNLDISEFDRYISELEKKIKGKGNDGKVQMKLPIDIKGTLSDEAIYDVKDIKTLIDTAKSSKAGRIKAESEKTTYKEDYEKAKKDWEDAKKALIEIEKDKSNFTSKQYEDAKKRSETSEKAYKDLGGITGSSLTKQESASEKLRKEQEKLKSLQDKQSKDSIRQVKDLEFEAAQAKISAMQEGSEKTIAQMNLDHQKEIETLKRNRQDYLQKKIEAERAIFEADPSNKGKSFDSSTVSLSKDEESMFNNLLESTISQQGNELATYYKEILAKYQGYAEKRLAAQKKFQQERDALVKAGASKEAIAENDYQRDETFKSIDNEFAMREDSFKAWADNIADLSLEKLRVLLVQAERELERSEFLNPKDPKLAGQRAKVTSLKNTISGKTAETNTSPNKRSQKEWQDLYKTLSKVENEFDEIGEAVGGTAGEILSAAGSITASTLKMIDGIKTLSDSSIWAISSTATAAEKAIKAVEKASVILAIIGAAMKIASEITQMISGESQEERMKKTVEYYNKIIDIYDQIINKQKESIKFGFGFASIEAATKAMDELNKKTEYNRKIAEVAGESGISFKDYAKEYERLAKEFDLSLTPMFIGAKAGIDTSELSKLTGQQLEYIRDNYKELWAGLRDEQRDALQAIIDAEKEGKEVIDAWQEAITGISYDSFYTEFIDTLSDMDSSAEDMAENFGEYLKKSILAAMVAKEFKGKIDELYQMWVDAGGKDSDKGTEISEDEARKIQEKQKELTEAMIKRREEMEKVYGWENTESTSQNSTQKGFETMSQDTGTELNGRFTALQVAGEEIKNQNILQSQSLNLLTMKSEDILRANLEIRDIAGETRDLIANSYLELVQISENTGAIIKPIKDMAKDIAEVKKNTSKL